ncbi:hypothetical protein [Thiocystis violacea]|uniref:hypothetical protein n=1 Tax=Thiocystis violacea TaxID=13725 RepID=UPI001904CAA0|nr:hypothetical protein [Thiocystis violacea]MBK1718394.1 hypothetical protein [Thiocystis violacea]
MNQNPPALITSVVAAVVISGCALSGGPVGAPPPLRQPSEAGTLVISRDGSLIGLFGTMRVKLNDRDIYRLGLNQSYSTRLDPGEYFLRYSIGLNDCGGAFGIRPRQTLRLRLSPTCIMSRQ